MRVRYRLAQALTQFGGWLEWRAWTVQRRLDKLAGRINTL